MVHDYLDRFMTCWRFMRFYDFMDVINNLLNLITFPLTHDIRILA